MLTYTGLLSRTLDIVGASDAKTTANAKSDLQQGLVLFKNAARRYWTRKSRVQDITATQQYYTLPADAVRVTEVTVLANGMTYPLEQISSEHRWNELNVVPSVTINVPQYYFIRGYNQIGLWPVPSNTVTGGLSIAYEQRIGDLGVVDYTTGTVTVTNASTAVTGAGTTFTAAMVGLKFSSADGFWYTVATYVSATSITIDSPYLGQTAAAQNFTIGQAPDIPEDYHLGLVYYAAMNFFLKRKDKDSTATYKTLFESLLKQYQDNYAAKTTGIVTTRHQNASYNLFNIPPNTIN